MDAKENLEPDNESKNIWKKYVQLKRFLNGNRKIILGDG